MPRGPWRKIKSRRGLFDRWLKRQIDTGKSKFTRIEIMKAHRMEPGRTSDDGAFYRYFMQQRKMIEDAMDVFWVSKEYKDLRGNGHVEEDIHRRLLEAALSYGITPMWSDPADGYYKLFDLRSYLDLKRRRATAIKSEIIRTAKTIRTIQEKFPQIGRTWTPPKLPRGSNGYFLKPAPSWACPYCGLTCRDSEELKGHLSECGDGGEK